MYETLQGCSFSPKLNGNNLVESKVKQVWQGKEIVEEDVGMNGNTEDGKNHAQHRDLFTIKLGKEYT